MRVLTTLGLDPLEEDAYRALVGVGGATSDDVAERLGTTIEVANQALAGLERLGLAGPSKLRAGRWVAAAPAVALRALLNDRRYELERAEAVAASLAERHRPEPMLEMDDVLEAVVGAEAVAQRFLQLQLGASREILALVTENPVAVSGENNSAEDVAVARGVNYRIVIERDAVAGATARAAIREGLRHAMDVRVVDRVPTKLVIADGMTAMIPLSAEGDEPAALVVHSAHLVAMITAIFDLVWRDAWPLRLDNAESLDETDETDETDEAEVVEVEPGPDDLDRQLLALLLTGASDARVAKQLDVGLRTVQRRVRALMDAAGATTRIQLGFVAHERAWITRDANPG